MKEITCPHCGKKFNLDDAGYADIVKQVRDEQFAADLRERLDSAEREKKTAVDLAKAEAQRALAEQAASKDTEIAELKTQVTSAAELAQARVQAELRDQIADLNTKLALAQQTNMMKDTEKDLALASLKQSHETQIKDRDAEIERLRDFKTRLSTKMLGETLEDHCSIQFATSLAPLLPNSYFKKDNDASSGSKGDYIFRDSDDSGTEFVSIMFEMKNESDTTATKKKNADFLKELDKDRQEKGCEYAVLVSVLEPDSELYNTGIVDMSREYPKMYVVRPQFFVPIITILRNAALASLQDKKALETFRAQNIDITNFEKDLQQFQERFGRNRDLASKQFHAAIGDIDKAIKHLENVKKSLLSADNNLRLANDKAQDLSIRNLTSKNPTMQAMFKAIQGVAPTPRESEEVIENFATESVDNTDADSQDH